MKLVINVCFGGFGLSDVATQRIKAVKGISEFDEYHESVRIDSDVIAVVEELGRKAWGDCAELLVVNVPEGKQFLISDYDGRESVIIGDNLEYLYN